MKKIWIISVIVAIVVTVGVAICAKKCNCTCCKKWFTDYFSAVFLNKNCRLLLICY